MDIEMRLMMGFQEYIYAAVTLFYGPELQPRVGLKLHKDKLVAKHFVCVE